MRNFLVALAIAAGIGNVATAAPAGPVALERVVRGVTLESDGRTASFTPAFGVYVAPPQLDRGAKALFSNIGYKYPKGLYFCCFGLTVSGPDSVVGGQSWIATKFTPAVDAVVTEIDAAVEHAAGTNQVTLGLYADGGGVPGAALKTFKVTGLQGISGCCGLAMGKDRSGIAVTGGTPYWIGLTTAKKASDAFDVWVDNSTDEISAGEIAVNQGSGWQSAGSFIPRVSFAVYGR